MTMPSDPHLSTSLRELPPGPTVLSAVNFSEGRRIDVISAIAGAIRQVPGAYLADCSYDVDHNRMVASILGPPETVRKAIVSAAAVAVREIDLRRHSGVHPRTGAIDVVPVVPIREVEEARCIELSREIAEDLSNDLSIPVYFYELSAVTGRPSLLPEIRRGGFEELSRSPLVCDRAPDLGPDRIHPSAGVAIVGARNPLVAYNILLDTPDVEVARGIARWIRAGRAHEPCLSGVRALGLYLKSRNLAQVSMNLTQPSTAPLPSIFDLVRKEAGDRGVNVLESEIVGLLPRFSLGAEPPERINWRDFRAEQIIENWLPHP